MPFAESDICFMMNSFRNKVYRGAEMFFKRRKKAVGEPEVKVFSEEDAAERMKEDVMWFKRIMSHNIRMPLAVIVGYGELLTGGGLQSREEEMDCIKKICSNIDYLDVMTKVLLDDEQGELLKQKEYFDILACIRRVTEYISRIALKSGIRVSVNCSRDTVTMYGNKISFMRALFNLIENSIRHMKRSGNVVITVEDNENDILIIYRDDGEGMPENEAALLSGQSGAVWESGELGRGIGMYLIRQTVAEHGGDIQIKTGEGKGMGVYMSFPKS